jgi:hypothetical protein
MPLALLFLIAGVIGCTGGFVAGHNVSDHRWQIKYDKLSAEYSDHLLDDARAADKQKAEQLARLTHQAGIIADIERRAQERSTSDEKTIADLRAKYGGLRILTRCPASADSNAVSKANDPGISLGTGSGAVVPRLDVGPTGQDFIDLAKAAERVRSQLIACQAVARSVQ